jgi:hypothetical protein
MKRRGEIATFRVDDLDCLVAASLACPGCLSSDVRWSLRPLRYDPRADCSCNACGYERTLFLRPDQALRLALHEQRPLDPTPRANDVHAVL